MTKCYKLLLLFLLVEPAIGFGQQEADSRLASLLAAAQQAQAVSNYAAAANAYQQAVRIRPAMPELWANLGLMQQQTGDTSAALHSFQQANRLNPSLYVPNLFLGIDYTRAGKPTEAINHLVEAERSHPTDPQVSLALGRAYLSLSRFSQASHELARALELDPKLSSAWFALGITDLDEVEEEARNMTAEEPESSFAQALYAESLEKQFRFREASEILGKIVDTNVQPPCLRSELGYSLLRQHDDSAAASEFVSDRAAHPECALAVLGQARIAIDAGANDQAMNLLGLLWERDHGYLRANAAALTDGLAADRADAWKAFLTQQRSEIPANLYSALAVAPGEASRDSVNNAAANPDSKTASSIHGTAEEYYASGQFQLCTGRLRSLAERQAGNLQLLATCAFFSGDYEQSSAAAEALAVLQPHSMTAHYWSIKAHEHLAFQALNRFEQLEPNSARSHILMGDIDRQRERFEEAATEYKRALDISPGDPAALLGLASAYLGNNDFDEAIETAHAALVRVPDDPEMNLVMAESMIGHHDFARAEPFLDKSVNVKPQMLPHLHALLGRVYAETGKIPEAIAELKLGESSDVDGSIHYQLSRLYRQVGDNKSAAEALENVRSVKRQRQEQKLIVIDDPDLTAADAGP